MNEEKKKEIEKKVLKGKCNNLTEEELEGATIEDMPYFAGVSGIRKTIDLVLQERNSEIKGVIENCYNDIGEWIGSNKKEFLQELGLDANDSVSVPGEKNGK